MDSSWPADARRDHLVGDWYLYQRKGGHRTSTDDQLVAYLAVSRAATRPKRYLDLGCGIGSVLLLTAHALRPETSLGIEGQAVSAKMAARTVRELPDAAPPIEIKESDFRQVALRPEHDLITGSPPYFPLGTGIEPSDPQRRACRFEVRGGVEAYCEAAASGLSDQGRFFLVHQTAFDDRVQAAGTSAGLFLTARLDVFARADRPDPFLTVYEFQRYAQMLEARTMSVRDAYGEITEEYAALRRTLGL